MNPQIPEVEDEIATLEKQLKELKMIETKNGHDAKLKMFEGIEDPTKFFGVLFGNPVHFEDFKQLYKLRKKAHEDRGCKGKKKSE